MTVECILMICFSVWFIYFCYKANQKTKFKKSGPYITYYSKTFKEWRYVKVWSDMVKPRFFHVHGEKEYDHWYQGEGLENLHWTQENLDSLKDQNIDKEQIRLIDKEDKYLKKVITDEQRRKEGESESGKYSL